MRGGRSWRHLRTGTDHRVMKLLLTWLVGVPALVAAMVVARAVSPQGMRAVPRTPAPQARELASCRGQLDLDKVLTTVPDHRHRVACDRVAIQ
jgi:hypothetical protein